MNYNKIYLVGDHHGLWNSFFKKIERYQIKHAVIIGVGDFGIGFKHPEKEKHNFRILNEDLKDRDIHFWAIRGNHDNPAYYYGQHNLSNFHLLPDYHKEVINGKRFLFVGGAISFDRQWNTIGKDYWLDEEFELKEDKAEECDVLVTHTGPSWIGPEVNAPLIQHAAKTDKNLIKDLLDERSRVDKLVELCKPQELFCGHFHQSVINTQNGCRARILDILEIYDYQTEASF